jgi:hypothetical protein
MRTRRGLAAAESKKKTSTNFGNATPQKIQKKLTQHASKDKTPGRKRLTLMK